MFGNPSINPTLAARPELVERARGSVRDFFRASPEEYEAIFTPNATDALRLVGEPYPVYRGDRFLLTFDHHNSVNAIGEFARARGAETTYIPSAAPELRVEENLLGRDLTDTAGDHHNLFAFPAQSNFSGVQHPLEWIEPAHSHGWHLLLRPRRVCADQPARPQRVASGPRGALVLPDVRLADEGRLFDRAPRRARQARAALVLRRNDRRGVRARVIDRPVGRPCQKTHRAVEGVQTRSASERTGLVSLGSSGRSARSMPRGSRAMVKIDHGVEPSSENCQQIGTFEVTALQPHPLIVAVLASGPSAAKRLTREGFPGAPPCHASVRNVWRTRHRIRRPDLRLRLCLCERQRGEPDSDERYSSSGTGALRLDGPRGERSARGL